MSLFSSCLVSLVNLFYSTVPSTVKVAYRKLPDSVINFPACGGEGEEEGGEEKEAAGP